MLLELGLECMCGYEYVNNWTLCGILVVYIELVMLIDSSNAPLSYLELDSSVCVNTEYMSNMGMFKFLKFFHVFGGSLESDPILSENILDTSYIQEKWSGSNIDALNSYHVS